MARTKTRLSSGRYAHYSSVNPLKSSELAICVAIRGCERDPGPRRTAADMIWFVCQLVLSFMIRSTFDTLFCTYVEHREKAADCIRKPVLISASKITQPSCLHQVGLVHVNLVQIFQCRLMQCHSETVYYNSLQFYFLFF